MDWLVENVLIFDSINLVLLLICRLKKPDLLSLARDIARMPLLVLWHLISRHQLVADLVEVLVVGLKAVGLMDLVLLSIYSNEHVRGPIEVLTLVLFKLFQYLLKIVTVILVQFEQLGKVLILRVHWIT